MSREVCGICWCPYDEETGECACAPQGDKESAMNREDIIRMAREAELEAYSILPHKEIDWDCLVDDLATFAALVAAAERKEWPRLDPVILWLENGCDPKEAAKELRVYAAAIRARGQQ